MKAPKKDVEKLKARFISLHGVRNTFLEDLHTGSSPASETGDFSDVKVISPYGEIPWNNLSRISDQEMRKLMLDIEKHIYLALRSFSKMSDKYGIEEFIDLAFDELFFKHGVSWDLTQEEFEKLHGKIPKP